MAAVLEIPVETTTELEIALAIIPGSRRFTAQEYQQLAEIGVLGEDERVELIEGRIVQMCAKSMNHAIATRRANRFFTKLLGDRAIVSVQDPILLNDYSEPEPDIVLVAPPEERYLDHHPTPKEVFLVLEIADSSLAYDRDERCPLFAQNRIVQFCLLNLKDRELEDYRDPGRSGYRSKQTYAEGQSFNLAAFPKISVKVKDLLPPVKAAKARKT